MQLQDRQFLMCFGCQRGGTTWLDDQLRNHPKFSFVPRKELRYLDPIYVHKFETISVQRIREFRRKMWDSYGEHPKVLPVRQTRELAWNAKYALVARDDYNDDWYRGLFDDIPADSVTGDFSPDYSLLPDEGVAHLARLVPNARLIFIMRDPVDRIISGATYVLRHYKNITPEEAQKMLAGFVNAPIQYQFSDYKTILTRFKAHFPEENIKILFQDDVWERPLDVLRDVCDHVGVDFDAKLFEASLAKSVNRSPKVEVPEAVTNQVREMMQPVLQWLGENVPSPTVEKWIERHKIA